MQVGLPVYQGSAAVKAGFIRKVYGILVMQLLLTVMGSSFFMFHAPTRYWVLSSPGMLMTASFAPFGFLMALFCYKDKHPLNMALLGGFTLCMAYTVGVVCAMYYENHLGLVVLQALILTAAVFVSLTSYVFVTGKDFSFLGAGASRVDESLEGRRAPLLTPLPLRRARYLSPPASLPPSLPPSRRVAAGAS